MSIVVEMGAGGVDWGQVIAVGAAVVQAVGSVAAIIAAAWITNHDRHETVRLAHGQRISALASILFKGEGLLRDLYAELQAAGNAARRTVLTKDRTEDFEADLRRIEAILANVPLHELDWELASAVMEMQKALGDGFLAIRAILSAGFLDAYGPEPTAVKLEPMRDAVNLAAEAAARIHNLAHRTSADPEARKMRIKPALVE